MGIRVIERGGVPISAFLSHNQRLQLREIGIKVDKWNGLLAECCGNEEQAKLLADLRGGIPNDEKPLVEGSSLRVAAQKHANNRQ